MSAAAPGITSLPRRVAWLARRGLARVLRLTGREARVRWPVAEVAAAGDVRLTFLCRSHMELMRARTFATKEEGTVEWIRSSVRPGQVFCDVGANIGLYSLLAAHHAGPAGVVYAFEPHVVNCSGLLANAAVNGLADRVKVLSVALNDSGGFFDFAYSSLDAGASFNQLRVNAGAAGPPARAAAVEVKAAVTLDELIARGVVRPPHHVKIDVDGNEPRIVRGMHGLLTGPAPPESVQVEVDPATATEIHELMGRAGYRAAVRHDTANGKQLIAGGADPASVPHNVIFRRG